MLTLVELLGLSEWIDTYRAKVILLWLEPGITVRGLSRDWQRILRWLQLTLRIERTFGGV
ncbi:hypothetical protein A1D17_19690 [Pseudomonas fluorescens]|uniref:Uncharacterized protein n=1 Tax=Pseudomonas fluorescens TaxID=294 RepID=A0A166P2H8_PSEFL|nr:hypothetical protein A1D17_19690 [Pseudomonas fluorescens]